MSAYSLGSQVYGSGVAERWRTGLELWDQNVALYAEELEALGNSSRADLVLDVAASTIPLFEPPFDDFFPELHRELVKSVLTLRAQAPASWWDDTAFARDFLTRYDLLPDVPTRPAVGPFLMALVRLFEAPGGFLSADDFPSNSAQSRFLVSDAIRNDW
ncbi:hypothetical protein [Streptomyces sp. NPDC059881]|uniref:hypothetical protein n=1 Tax=Streptomyces sp. NPDC059881 TaxID=3346986 RepID=UPI00366314D5